jgi:hypothetical protein
MFFDIVSRICAVIGARRPPPVGTTRANHLHFEKSNQDIVESSVNRLRETGLYPACFYSLPSAHARQSHIISSPRLGPLLRFPARKKLDCVHHSANEENDMVEVAYQVVEHDGGWAYRFDGVYSETFPSHAAALAAAQRVAGEQRAPGENAEIQYETKKGEWREERADGHDRPTTKVVDQAE